MQLFNTMFFYLFIEQYFRIAFGMQGGNCLVPYDVLLR